MAMSELRKQLFDSFLPDLAGGRLKQCGLNADWCVSCYWVVDKKAMCRYDGTDRYILDHEDGMFSLVSRKEDDGEGDGVTVIYTAELSEAECRYMLTLVTNKDTMPRLTPADFNQRCEESDSCTVLRYTQSKTRYGVYVQLVKGLAFSTWFVGMALDERASIIEAVG